MSTGEHPHSGEQQGLGGEADGGFNESHSSPSSPLEEEGFDNGKKGGADEKKTGRRKINIEFIEDKSRRHITFSKRKAGIMKKAYELSTLTGTQVLLLVASETGHVYTFATPKLQPLITKPEGKNLIQSCLNAPEVAPVAPAPQHHQARMPGYSQEPPIMYPTANELGGREALEVGYEDENKKEKNTYPMGGIDMNYAANQYPPPSLVPSGYGMPPVGGVGSSGIPRGYIPQGYGQAASQYSAPNAVQGQYSQQHSQYPSNYPMHSLPSQWGKGGMQGMPLNQMNQGQGSQAQSPSMAGMAMNKQSDHSTDHT